MKIKLGKNIGLFSIFILLTAFVILGKYFFNTQQFTNNTKINISEY